MDDWIRRYKLGTVFYMMSQGIPFMQAGEEMLRSKPNGRGGYVENSYKSPDRVNSIKWNLLKHPDYRDMVNYYRGLIRFRKAHPVLRLTSAYDVLSHVVPVHCEHPQVGAFHIDGSIPGEPAEELFLIFSAAETAQTLPLPKGTWHVCINSKHAGIVSLEAVESAVTLPPISAMVLVKDKSL